MSDRVSIHLRLPADVAAEVEARAEELAEELRGSEGDPRTGGRHALLVRLIREGLADLEPLEHAVETVVEWLDNHGREDLARLVALATDPTPPEERAEAVATIRRWWRP